MMERKLIIPKIKNVQTTEGLDKHTGTYSDNYFEEKKKKFGEKKKTNTLNQKI